jgi:predicted Abi (CAAX) family protease
LRGWQLGLLWGIGICLGWFFHDSMMGLAVPVGVSEGKVVSAVEAGVVGGTYRANGEWMGRLILPSQVEVVQSGKQDWVWFEVGQAPISQQQLVGKIVRLSWSPQSLIRSVITDVQFTSKTIASQKTGNVHPQRLNGRKGVGALQSLAGSRPIDDIWVRLDGVKLVGSQELTIEREPIQVTGKLRGLVRILGTDSSRTEARQTACPGSTICPSEYFRVQHYNSQSQRFNGQIESVRIPQVAVNKSGIFPSTIRDLERSPAGTLGWYIYGDKDPQGLFTVGAIEPRSLFTLTSAREIDDGDGKLDYFVDLWSAFGNRQHWQDTPANKGKISKVVFGHPDLKLGTKALIIHSFGATGGKNGDKLSGKTVTGHFAYGVATVIHDEFTHELQWSIEYNQVYAHNPNAIVAGRQDWATYMGNLQRGWLATRPVADLLITYPPVTEDYDFGGIKLSPLTELQRQLQISAARYRTGNGTGNASVTPSTSCVQDSNQALYITIEQLTDRSSSPQIQAWLVAHPQHPQTLRFARLKALGADLKASLAPLGVIRPDWKKNAATLAGIDGAGEFTTSSNPLTGLMSWRTMLPRGAQDGIGKIFSSHGAGIWFLNTFQVGGWNPDIYPLAPTILFGQIPIVSTIVLRLWAGIVTLPTMSGWLWGLGLLIGYGIIACGFGFRSKFLSIDYQLDKSKLKNILSLGHLFLMPALVEEILFRLLLIPHPIETATSTDIWIWSIVSLFLFIIYHPLNALTLYPPGKPTFMDWRFLTLAGLLGIVCTSIYSMSGSIWLSVLIHWVAVWCWLKLFGGEKSLSRF